jgi:NAD(P)-dependent dehydrogenase (short-subunit alcohol dehydrogenase family)
MRLSGKVAAITGAARGFGAAAAELFAREGASVVIGDLLEEQGQELAARIRDTGGRAEFVHCDVTSESSVAAFTARAKEAYGKLDVLVANAGILIPGRIEDVTEDDYGRMIDVNLKGTWLACKHALPHMREAGGGSIVITSSAGGLRGSRTSALYSASKGAVLMLGKALALQTADEGIRCNVVAPGPVATDFYRLGGVSPEEYTELASGMVPMGHLGKPVDIAYAMLFLASDESKFCTGSVLSADGGFTA